MNCIDVVVDSTNSTYGGNMTVVPATLVKNLGDNCSIPGIIDMDMDSLNMKSVFENNPDLDKYYIINFNIRLSDEIESYFEIGSFPEEDAADEFFCVNTLPMIKESHMIASIGPQDHGLQPNFTFWWQYDIEYFEFGDKRSVGEAQTIVDNETSEVLGNFTSIFYPDPVPENLCDYLNKTGSKFEIKVGEGTTSLSFDDLYLEDKQSCLIVHNSNMPSNLVVSGLPFYKKYLIKHDYGNEQVCFAEKKKYNTLTNNDKTSTPIEEESSDTSSSASKPASPYFIILSAFIITIHSFCLN